MVTDLASLSDEELDTQIASLESELGQAPALPQLTDQQLDAEIDRLSADMSPAELDGMILQARRELDPFAAMTREEFDRDWLAKKNTSWHKRLWNGLAQTPEMFKYVFGNLWGAIKAQPQLFIDPEKYFKSYAEGGWRGTADITMLGRGMKGEIGDWGKSQDEHMAREYDRYLEMNSYERLRDAGLLFKPEETFEELAEFSSIILDPTNLIPFTAPGKLAAKGVRAAARGGAKVGALGFRGIHKIGDITAATASKPRKAFAGFLTDVAHMHPGSAEGATIAGTLAAAITKVPYVSPVGKGLLAAEGLGVAAKVVGETGEAVLNALASKNISRRFLTRLAQDGTAPMWVRRLSNIARKSGGEWAMDKAFNAIISGVEIGSINAALQWAAFGDAENVGAGFAQGIAMAPLVALAMPNGGGLRPQDRVDYAVQNFMDLNGAHLDRLDTGFNRGAMEVKPKAGTAATFAATKEGRKTLEILAALDAIAPEAKLPEKINFLTEEEYIALFGEEVGKTTSGQFDQAKKDIFIKTRTGVGTDRAVASTGLHEVGHYIVDNMLATNRQARDMAAAAVLNDGKNPSGVFISNVGGKLEELSPAAAEFKRNYEFHVDPETGKIKVDADGKQMRRIGDEESIKDMDGLLAEMGAETIGEMLYRSSPTGLLGHHNHAIRGLALQAMSKMFSKLMPWRDTAGVPKKPGGYMRLDPAFEGNPVFKEFFKNYLEVRKHHMDFAGKLEELNGKLVGRDGKSPREMISMVAPGAMLFDPEALAAMSGRRPYGNAMKEALKKDPPAGNEVSLGPREKGNRASGHGQKLSKAAKEVVKERLGRHADKTLKIIGELEKAIRAFKVIGGWYSKRGDHKGNNPVTYRDFQPFALSMSLAGNISVHGWNIQKLHDAIMLASELGLVEGKVLDDGTKVPAHKVLEERVRAASERQRNGQRINDELVATLFGARYGEGTQLADPRHIEFARELNRRRAHPSQSLRLDTMQGFEIVPISGFEFNPVNVSMNMHPARPRPRPSPERVLNRVMDDALASPEREAAIMDRIVKPNAMDSGSLVTVDVVALDKLWERMGDDLRIVEEGENQLGTRYQDIHEYFESGKPIEASQVFIQSHEGVDFIHKGKHYQRDPYLTISFDDGRHRFAAMRDLGMKHTKVWLMGDYQAAKNRGIIVDPDTYASPERESYTPPKNLGKPGTVNDADIAWFGRNVRAMTRLPSGINIFRHKWDRSFHLSTLANRILDFWFSNEVFLKLKKREAEFYKVEGLKTYDEKFKERALMYPEIKSLFADYFAALPEHKGLDLKTETYIDPHEVAKEFFGPGDPQKPLGKTLEKIANLLDGLGDRGEGIGDKVGRELYGMVEIPLNSLGMTELKKTHDEIFERVEGLTWEEHLKRAATFSAELSPEFYDKMEGQEVDFYTPIDPDTYASPERDPLDYDTNPGRPLIDGSPESLVKEAAYEESQPTFKEGELFAEAAPAGRAGVGKPSVQPRSLAQRDFHEQRAIAQRSARRNRLIKTPGEVALGIDYQLALTQIANGYDFHIPRITQRLSYLLGVPADQVISHLQKVDQPGYLQLVGAGTESLAFLNLDTDKVLKVSQVDFGGVQPAPGEHSFRLAIIVDDVSGPGSDPTGEFGFEAGTDFEVLNGLADYNQAFGDTVEVVGYLGDQLDYMLIEQDYHAPSRDAMGEVIEPTENQIYDYMVDHGWQKVGPTGWGNKWLHKDRGYVADDVHGGNLVKLEAWDDLQPIDIPTRRVTPEEAAAIESYKSYHSPERTGVYERGPQDNIQNDPANRMRDRIAARRRRMQEHQPNVLFSRGSAAVDIMDATPLGDVTLAGWDKAAPSDERLAAIPQKALVPAYLETGEIVIDTNLLTDGELMGMAEKLYDLGLDKRQRLAVTELKPGVVRLFERPWDHTYASPERDADYMEAAEGESIAPPLFPPGADMTTPKHRVIQGFVDKGYTVMRNPFDYREILVNEEFLVELSDRGNGVRIGSVRSLEKGKGSGTRGMLALKDVLDATGISAYGNVEAFGQGGLTDNQLAKWYRKLGFQVESKKQGDGTTRHTFKYNEPKDDGPTIIKIKGFDDIVYSPERDAAYMEAAEAGDTKTAGKMVEAAARAAGYTIGPVYHGTDAEFTVFDPSRSMAGAGIHFASKKSQAERGSIVKPFYLNLKNPLRVRDQFSWDPQVEKLKAAGHDGLVYLNRWEGIKNPPRSSRSFTDNQFLKKHPEAADSFMVFDPNQIKSADPITRDDQGNIIPLSERFKPESDDVRYSPERTYFHGSSDPNFSPKPGKPLFLTESRDMARTYGPNVRAWNIKLKKPASDADVYEAAIKVDNKEPDVRLRQGEFEIKEELPGVLLLNPRVVETLKAEGFDGWEGWDYAAGVTEGDQAPAVAVFDLSRARLDDRVETPRAPGDYIDDDLGLIHTPGEGGTLTKSLEDEFVDGRFEVRGDSITILQWNSKGTEPGGTRKSLEKLDKIYEGIWVEDVTPHSLDYWQKLEDEGLISGFEKYDDRRHSPERIAVGKLPAQDRARAYEGNLHTKYGKTWEYKNLTPGEQKTLKKHRLAAAKHTRRVINSEFPEAVPLKIVGLDVGSKADTFDADGKVKWESEDYHLTNAPAAVKARRESMKKNHARIEELKKQRTQIRVRGRETKTPKSEIDYGVARVNARIRELENAWLEPFINKQGDRLYAEFQQGMKVPEIAKAVGWYKRMRDQFYRIFGASAEKFAQLNGATSARTPVAENFAQAMEAIQLFSMGKYDNLLERYDQHLAAGKRPRDFKDVPLRANGKKYNANSHAVMQVLHGSWLETVGGPKTPNYAGNFTGRSLKATIDVWAARTLRRLLYGHRKQWRIQPRAETGVNSQRMLGGEPVGDFGLGQLIFDRATRSAQKQGYDINPDDLQAAMWFYEKLLWDKKGWTKGAGSELASYDPHMNLYEFGQTHPTRTTQAASNIKRMSVGVTSYSGGGINVRKAGSIGKIKDKDYSEPAQQEMLDNLQESARLIPGHRIVRINKSDGLYGEIAEPTLDLELVLDNKHDLWAGQASAIADFRIAVMKEAIKHGQWDTFFSMVADKSHPNARPGIEILFKENYARTNAAGLAQLLAHMRSHNIDGYTIARDNSYMPGFGARGKVIGIRAQYIPEISARWDPNPMNHLDPILAGRSADKWYYDMEKAIKDIDTSNIAHIYKGFYDTQVFGKEEYNYATTREAHFRGTIRFKDELQRRRQALAKP